jgi:hypothetical protein
MDVKTFASLGGKARWKGVSTKQRSEQMKRVRKGVKKVINTPSVDELAHNKQVR